MTKTPIFEGAGTALITPMNSDGVDFEALGKLIDHQIEQGIDALIICGTTGEKSTLDDAEHKEVLRFSLERAAGRVPMIAGTGSNDTRYGISMTRHACELGYDGLLVVTPYYNKTTQKGLIASFNAFADALQPAASIYDLRVDFKRLALGDIYGHVGLSYADVAVGIRRLDFGIFAYGNRHIVEIQRTPRRSGTIDVNRPTVHSQRTMD